MINDNWKDRALSELKELHERIEKLHAFINSGSDKVYALHKKQLTVMREYEGILLVRCRIEGWKDA